MAVNLIDSTDISVSQVGSDIKLNINNKNTLGDVVVDSIRTKNMFDGVFTQGHHTSTTETNRICNVGLLPIKSVSGKSYVFSTNLPNTFKWKIINCSTNQLNPTIYTDTNYVSSGDRDINCYNDGYLIIIIGKNDNSTIRPSDVSSYWFQVEEGSTSTTYSAYQDLNPDEFIKNSITNRIGDRFYVLWRNSGANTSITINAGTIDRQTIMILGTASNLNSICSIITSSTSTTKIKNLGDTGASASRSGNVITISGLTTYSYLIAISYDAIS